MVFNTPYSDMLHFLLKNSLNLFSSKPADTNLDHESLNMVILSVLDLTCDACIHQPEHPLFLQSWTYNLEFVMFQYTAAEQVYSWNSMVAFPLSQ